MEYDLELDRAVSLIEKAKAKTVLVQLPDGLKPRAKEVVDTLKAKTGARIVVWAGSCFGACDIPVLPEGEYDLLIQWGHSAWKA
ncbi:TPA: hypothetical protein HA265_07475 [Candidatus Woesearchaeota archaeon]|nr:hypothetical protein [Candidatus Woesearchaeota archaeon]